MKKILYIFAFVAAAFLAACSVSEEPALDGKGAVTFSFSTTRAELEEVYSMMKFRVYAHSSNGEKTLVRLYTYDEIKDMKMWLVAGDYSIAVEGGEKSPASFTEIYYQGGTAFSLAAGEQKQVDVVVRPKNTLIKVVFEDSVVNKLSNAKTVVAISDSFDEEKIASGEVASLAYEQTRVGYYMIDAEQSSFVWNFTADVPSKGTSVNKSGIYTPEGGFKEGVMYTITFKYSADLGGYITMNIEVVDDVEELDDTLLFKPEPQIKGETLDATTRMYVGMEPVKYQVEAIADLQTLKFTVGGKSYIYTQDGDNSAVEGYFTVMQITEGSNLGWMVELGDKFPSLLMAGVQKVKISAIDVEGAEGEVEAMFFGEGAYDVEIVDEWNAVANIKAYVNNASAEAVKIYYRESGAEEWSEAEATLSNDNIYVAQAGGIDGNRTYEYYLSYEGEQKGLSASYTTVGKQIPNGGMEEWQGTSPLLPYIGTQYWDTGNHGAATIGGNVTVNSGLTRPDSDGKYSAYLKSQFVGVAGFGKFAAGNIFFGTYLGTSGTNGQIGFGHPFSFDYRPKALVVWYKGQVGKIDELGDGSKIGLSSGQSDKSQIYVWLCNWNGQHVVDTADTNTFVNPTSTATTAEGNILAYGVWSREITSDDAGSDDGWHRIEIPITYREGEGFLDVKPNYLVISCASSAYGDYFAGSTTSYMYVDDFEFVY